MSNVHPAIISLAILVSSWWSGIASAADAATDEVDDDLKRDRAPSTAQPEQRYTPPEPHPNDQRLGPVTPGVRRSPAEPFAEVALLLGTTLRGSDSGNVKYEAGISRGVSLRVKPMSWLGLRAAGSLEDFDAQIADNALGQPGSRYSALELSTVTFRLMLEPELRWHPRLLTFVGLGIAGQHFHAATLHSDGDPAFSLGPRTGTGLEFPLEVGAVFDIVPGRVVLGLVGAIGLFGSQGGELFDANAGPYTQTLDSKSRFRQVDALPGFSSSIEFLALFGVLL